MLTLIVGVKVLMKVFDHNVGRWTVKKDAKILLEGPCPCTSFFLPYVREIGFSASLRAIDHDAASGPMGPCLDERPSVLIARVCKNGRIVCHLGGGEGQKELLHEANEEAFDRNQWRDKTRDTL